MSFLAPIMLIGAAICAIPIGIHLIGKKRAKEVSFSALHLLLGSSRKLATRHQFIRVALLVSRILICLALAFIFAKPYVSCISQRHTARAGPQAVFVIVDNSLASLYQGSGSRTMLDIAKARVRQIVSEVGAQAHIALVSTAPSAKLLVPLTLDHSQILTVLDAIVPAYHPSETSAALDLAGQSLAEESHAQKNVYLFSTLAAKGFHDPKPWKPPQGVGLVVVDLGEGRSLDNVAVTDLEVELDADNITATVELSNFGSSEARDIQVVLRSEDKELTRGTATVPAGKAISKQLVSPLRSIALGRGIAGGDLSVTISDDGLIADNRRYARVMADRNLRVLLVNGDPHTIRYRDELFYARPALHQTDREQSDFSVTVATVDDLADIQLDPFRAIVFANVAPLAAQDANRVAAWVQQGGGLLMTAGSRVQPDAYNQTMKDLLPQRLQTAADLTHASQGTERDTRALRLAKFDISHPVLQIFSEQDPALREAKFHKIMLLDPTTETDTRNVIVRFTNGASALVEKTPWRGQASVLGFDNRSRLDRFTNSSRIPATITTTGQISRPWSRLGWQKTGVGWQTGFS